MKILLLADTEDAYLWDYYQPDHLQGAELILSAGDLKASYLSFLVTMSNKPVFYVHGNHDDRYDTDPPEGCICIDDQIINYKGIRILGLGGSRKYNGKPYQYTEKEMRWRIFKLKWKIKRAGGVDIVLTHAPVRDYGDQEGFSHQGFEAFKKLLDEYQPAYLVHGHVHMSYQPAQERIQHYGKTTIINAYKKYLLNFEERI